MSVSADTLQFAMVEETTTPGVTPATPAFETIRATGEGLTYTPTTTISGELNPERQVSDLILTGGTAQGPANFEFADSPWMLDAWEGLFGSRWVGAATPFTLQVGDEQITYTIEKRFTMPDASFSYFRYRGAAMNTLTLTIAPGNPTNGNFGIMALDTETTATIITGATYVPASTFPVMSSPQVQNVTLVGVDFLAVTRCFSTLTLDITNNIQALQCIGSLGARELVLGRFEARISGQLYFTNSDFYEAMVNQSEFQMVIEMQDTAPTPNLHTWKFDLARCRLSRADIVAGGTGQPMVVDFEAQALLHPTKSTIEVTRTIA
jgi:hypothetical protein